MGKMINNEEKYNRVRDQPPSVSSSEKRMESGQERSEDNGDRTVPNLRTVLLLMNESRASECAANVVNKRASSDEN